MSLTVDPLQISS